MKNPSGMKINNEKFVCPSREYIRTPTYTRELAAPRRRIGFDPRSRKIETIWYVYSVCIGTNWPDMAREVNTERSYVDNGVTFLLFNCYEW